MHPKHVRGDEDAGNDGERSERQSPVDDEHRDADREQREQIADTRDHARGEQLVQRFDVRRHAGHEPPHRIAVEERDRQPLEVREDLDAEIAHHALAEKARQHRLAVREQELEQQRGGEQRRARERDPGISTRDRDIDDALRERGADELENSIGE